MTFLKCSICTCLLQIWMKTKIYSPTTFGSHILICSNWLDLWWESSPIWQNTWQMVYNVVIKIKSKLRLMFLTKFQKTPKINCQNHFIEFLLYITVTPLVKLTVHEDFPFYFILRNFVSTGEKEQYKMSKKDMNYSFDTNQWQWKSVSVCKRCFWVCLFVHPPNSGSVTKPPPPQIYL